MLRSEQLRRHWLLTAATRTRPMRRALRRSRNPGVGFFGRIPVFALIRGPIPVFFRYFLLRWCAWNRLPSVGRHRKEPRKIYGDTGEVTCLAWHKFLISHTTQVGRPNITVRDSAHGNASFTISARGLNAQSKTLIDVVIADQNEFRRLHFERCLSIAAAETAGTAINWPA